MQVQQNRPVGRKYAKYIIRHIYLNYQWKAGYEVPFNSNVELIMILLPSEQSFELKKDVDICYLIT